jgi:hypothetical protein
MPTRKPPSRVTTRRPAPKQKPRAGYKAALTQEKILSEIKTGVKGVIAYPENRKTIRVDVPVNNINLRTKTAIEVSKLFDEAIISPKDPKIVLLGTDFRVIIKPAKGSKKTGSAPEYGAIGKINLRSFDTNSFASLTPEFSRGSVPTNVKEASDVKCVSDLNTQITEMMGSSFEGVDLTIAGFRVKNIVGAIPVTNGEPKADVMLVQYDKARKRLSPAFYMSYKMGSDAKGFQNYSGLSDKSAPEIFKDPETIRFYEKLYTLQKQGNRKSCFRKLKSQDIIGKSLWGMKYGSGTYGLDNVHLIAQGELNISRGTVNYDHIQKNGNFNLTGGYDPVFGARYTPGRGNVGPNDIRIKDMRLGIFPMAYFMSRDAREI